MSVERFHAVLASLGPAPTPKELAEILWLATRLPAQAPTWTANGEAKVYTTEAEKASHDAAPVPVEKQPPPDTALTVPIHAATTTPAASDTSLEPARPVRLAVDPALPHRLELLRALRPLKRRVPSRRVREFDEEATLNFLASRSSGQGRAALVPILRPAPERWLDAVLVIDGHPTSLLLWSPLVQEVHGLLVQLGAFRDVRMRYLHARPDGAPGLSARPDPDPDRLRNLSEINDPSGRRLVLILTDAVAPHWNNSIVKDAMRRWAAAGPLAVLQALPEALWRRTALPTIPAQLRRAPFSAANTDLTYTGRRRSSRLLPAGSIPVPVLELSADWLGPWARLVAGSGSPSTDTAVTLLPACSDSPRAPAPVDVRSPERRLQDFHATASRDACRLLACLSAVPLSISVMRVVQAAMLPGSPPSVLAEVLFSGLIRPTDTGVNSSPPADRPHEFLPTLRASLLQSLRDHELDQVLLEVSRYVERGADGASQRISGLLPDPAGSATVQADGIPWARLRESALVRAGLITPRQGVQTAAGHVIHSTLSPYQLIDLITHADFSDVYLGEDASGHRAVVKVLPENPHRAQDLEEPLSRLLLVEAEALRRMDGIYAPSFFGVDRNDRPTWLAMDHVTSRVRGGIAPSLLHAPWWQHGPASDFHALRSLALALAHALARAHSAGIVHGNLSPHAVLLVPDSVTLISWVYAQFDGHPHPLPQYRRRATGYLPPEGYPADTPLEPSFDIYGLGAILLHEVTRDTRMRLDPNDLSRLPSHLGGVSALIQRCLSVDPAQRPTAKKLIELLKNLKAPISEAADATLDGADRVSEAEALAEVYGYEDRAAQFRYRRSAASPAQTRSSADSPPLIQHRATGESQAHTRSRMSGEPPRPHGEGRRFLITVADEAHHDPFESDVRQLRAAFEPLGYITHVLSFASDPVSAVRAWAEARRLDSEDRVVLYLNGYAVGRFDGQLALKLPPLTGESRSGPQRRVAFSELRQAFEGASALLLILDSCVGPDPRAGIDFGRFGPDLWMLTRAREVNDANFSPLPRALEEELAAIREGSRSIPMHPVELADRLTSRMPHTVRRISTFCIGQNNTWPSFFAAIPVLSDPTDLSNEKLPLDGLHLRGHTNTVMTVAFSPDGRLLATGSQDETVRLWNPTTGQCIGPPWIGHASTIWSVAFAPDGRLLASASEDMTVRLWDPSTGQPTSEPLVHHDIVHAVAFSPDGRLLVTGSEDMKVRLWDPDSRQPIGRPLSGHLDAVMAVAFSPDGRLLATASSDRSVRLWDPDSRQPIGRPLSGHLDAVMAVTFSPDGQLLATAGKDATVRLWDPQTGQPVRTLTGHTNTVMGVAFSSDGQLLATAGHDSALRLWVPATGQLVSSHSTDSTWAVAYSPDGRHLATAGQNGTVRLWPSR